MHDGSMVMLKKLENEYDPRDRWQALHMLEDAQRNNWLVTGLIYVDPEAPSLFDIYNLPEMPLNRLPNEKLRPSAVMLDQLNTQLY